jgi:site-specific DNA recombinase
MANDPVPRVLGYCRASTRKQVDSPDVQRGKIQDYAAFHKLGVVSCFIDPAKSGKVPWEEREGGRALFAQLRPGDHVIIAKLDRAFRRLSDCVVILERFERMGVKLHIVNLLGGAIDLSSPMGRFMIHILAAFAELERSFISERTRDGLAAKKRKKTQYCHYPGYGFRWEKSVVDGRRVRVKVPDDKERGVMRSIVALRTQPNPMSWQEITEHLAQLGIVNKEGRPWTEIRVRRACKAELLLQQEESSPPDREPVAS